MEPTKATPQSSELIAAAPDLLRALICHSALDDMSYNKGIATLKEQGWDGEQDIDMFIAKLRRAAIAKARGEVEARDGN